MSPNNDRDLWEDASVSPLSVSSSTRHRKPPRRRRRVIAHKTPWWLGGGRFFFRYLSDIVATAFSLLRKPLSILVFLWLLGLFLSRLIHTFSVFITPLCFLPGVSRFLVCGIASLDAIEGPQWADYPKLVDVQSSTFEQLLDESVGNSGLSLEIKKAEMATSDLVTLIRVSDLKSKDLLATSLVDFMDEARKTSRGLQKLTSKINGAVDSIIAVNDYALHTIEAVNSKTSSLDVIQPLDSSDQTRRTVLETFHDAMNILTGQMQRVILEAQLSLLNLDRLEQMLIVLYELVAREDASISSAKDELLSELWTKLGGNRRELYVYESHLRLLRNVGAYRTRALAHVVAALQTLQSMNDDMEDIRERVAVPDIVGERIPVEVQMRSIKSGMERLKAGQLKARNTEAQILRKVLGIEEGA